MADTSAERAHAWSIDDPDELRRAGAEWRALGYRRYATYLEEWADYREGLAAQPPSPIVRRPW